jgi:hypothetical protein
VSPLELLAAWVRRVAEWVLVCGNVSYRGSRRQCQRKRKLVQCAPGSCGLSGRRIACMAARYRVVEVMVFAPQLGERRLAQPVVRALEEADDLVFFGAAAAQEAVALQVYVAAEERADWLRELFGFCELIQPFCE